MTLSHLNRIIVQPNDPPLRGRSRKNLELNSQHALTKTDAWSGVLDAKERRRRQNRLNQRAYRQRKEPGKWTPLRSKIEDIQQGHQVLPPRYGRDNDDNDDNDSSMVRISADHLLTIIHQNIFRAAIINSSIFALGNMIGCDYSLEAAFGVTRLPYPDSTPLNLYPTDLQRTMSHPRWMDLLPIPGVRDMLITNMFKMNYNDFCLDLLGLDFRGMFGSAPSSGSEEAPSIGSEGGRYGLIVWGDPWMADSWEVTEGFLQKWGWLVRKGCKELLQSTNRWRDVRGEDPLVWEIE